MSVEWSPAALSDIGRIYDYVASFNTAAARRLADRLIDAAEGLVKFPDRGRLGFEGYRELTVVRPYILIYQATGKSIRIMRIWHGAQDRPGTESP